MLSRLTRDLLSVPTTGAGVERLFNSARDICYYRRGSLHKATIQDLMMYMCLEKFTLEGQQLTRLEKLIESESQEALKEDKALRANKEDATPISDDEEVEETKDVESNIEPEALYQAEGILAGTQQPSMYN